MVLAVHALLRVIRTRVGSVSTYVRKKRLPYEKETSECDSFCVVLPKDLITLLPMSYLIKKDVDVAHYLPQAGISLGFVGEGLSC